MAAVIQLTNFVNWLVQDATNTTSETHRHGFVREDVEDMLGLPDNGSPDREESVQTLLQEYAILLEYERMQDIIPSNMYVFPSYECIREWHGVLFVWHGLYAGGTFRFQLDLPENYPVCCPSLHFLSEVFHPMVEVETGRVDLGVVFPVWRPGQDFAIQCLPHLSNLFLRHQYLLNIEHAPLNADAQEVLSSQPDLFAKRALECAKNSTAQAYDEKSGSPFCFPKAPEAAHERILTALRANDASDSLEERRTAFIEWFCNEYGLPEDDLVTNNVDVTR